MARLSLFSLLFLVFSLISAHHATAQSVVYYCPEMGAIGYAYSNDEDGHDLKTLEKQARDRCAEHGGRNCTLLSETPKVGWGGIVKGKDVTGAPLVLATGHQQSEANVRSELRRKYLFRDGVEFNDILIITWHAE